MQIEKKKEKTWHTVIFYLKKNIKKLEPICILLKALAVRFSRRPTLTKISWRRYTISTGCFFISGVRRGNPTDLTKIVDKTYFAIQRVSPPKKTIPSKKTMSALYVFPWSLQVLWVLSLFKPKWTIREFWL